MTLNVALILQPHAERNRSMRLYAERLAAGAPRGQSWTVVRVPAWPGDAMGRWSEVTVPPLWLPRLRADVAHVVDQAHAGYLRWLRVPTVVTVHDLIPWKARQGAYPDAAAARVPNRAWWWLRGNLAALPRAAALVAPSRATADDLRRFCGRDARVVPHGIDPAFAAPPDDFATGRAAAALASLNGRPFMLTVSSGYFYKNEAGAAAAFVHLARQRSDLAWVRVGAPLAGDVAAALGSDEDTRARVLTIARADPPTLAALYRRAATLVFVSWDEGFGWPPLEAMAAGCPVVSSDRGALAETAAPAALVAAPDDAAGIAAAVTRVLDEPGLAASLRAAGHAHAARYRWDEAVAAMAAIYEAVAQCG